MSENLTAKLELVAEGNATQAVEAFTGGIEKLLEVVTLGNAAMAAFAGSIALLIKVGVDENEQQQKAIRTTTTLLETVYKYTDALDAHVAATHDATEAIELLEKAQFFTLGSATDLFDLYKKLVPAMAAAGETETPKMVAFTKTVAQLADVTKQSYEEAAAQLSRMMTTGQLARGGIGNLLRSLGITNEQLASWKQGGDLVERLMEKLAPIKKNSDEAMGSVEALFGQIKKGFSEIVKVAEVGTFDTFLKDTLKSIRDFFVTIGKDDSVLLNQSIIDPLRAFFQSLGAVVATIFSVVGTVLSAVGEVVKTIVGMFGGGGVDWTKTLSSAFLSMGQIIILVLGYLKIGFLSIAEIVKAAAGALVEFTAGLLSFGAGVYTFLGALTDRFPKVTEMLSNLTGVNVAEVGKVFKAAGSTMADAADQTLAQVDKNKSLLESLGKIVEDVGRDTKASIAALEALKTKVVEVQKAIDDTNKKPTGTGGYSDAAKKALEQLQNFVAKTTIALSHGGLEGIAKELEEVDQKVNTLSQDFTAKIAGLAPAVASELSGPIAILKTALDGLLKTYREAEDIRISAENQRKFTLGVTELSSQYQADSLQKIEFDRQTNEAQIREKQKTLETYIKLDADYEVNRRVLKITADEAIARLDEQARLSKLSITTQQTKDWLGYLDVLVQQAKLAGKSSVEAMQQSLATVAQSAMASAKTMSDGIKAAWLQILSTVRTNGQLMADFLIGVWGTIEKGFEDSLMAVITGDFKSLGDILKGVFKSIEQEFVKMVAGMVKSWLLGTGEMKDDSSGLGSWLATLFGKQGVGKAGGAEGGGYTQYGDYIGTTGYARGSGGAASAVGGYATGALTGLGVGTAIGGFSNAPGFSGGAQIGGVIGGIAGIALGGIAAGAAGGAGILGGLTPVLAGISATGYGIIIAAIIAIIAGIIAVLASPNTEQKVWGSSFTPQIKLVGENIATSLGQTYAKSLLKDAAGFTATMKKSIGDYLIHAQGFEVHAGSAEDIQGDIKTLLTGIIPSELLHVLIGQTRTGGQDVAGISGASKYGGTLDPNAPINKMLTDLGFTAEKVNWLAGQIDVLGSEEWLKELDVLVDVVAKLDQLSTEYKKTYADQVKDMEELAAKSPAQLLQSQADGVRDLLLSVANFSGAGQLSQAQKGIDAAQQFYQNAVQAMQQLAAAAKQIREESATMVSNVRDALKSPAEIEQQWRSKFLTDIAALGTAASAGQISAAWEKVKNDFTAMTNVLVNRIKDIQGVLAALKDLRDMVAAGPGPSEQSNPFQWLVENSGKVTAAWDAMKAAAPGSQDQIDNARTYATLMRDRYTEELAMLERVRSTLKSINESIDQQIFDINLGQQGPAGKSQALQAEINRLIGTLPGAQSPEELQGIVSKIQGLGGQYLGLFGENDPNRAGAASWVTNMLETVRGIANSMGKDWDKLLTTDISTIGAKLSAAETIMSTALDKVTGDLNAVITNFTNAATQAGIQLDTFGQQIADQLALLAPLLDSVRKEFTDLDTVLKGGGGSGPGHHGPDQGLNDVADAADGAAASLNALAASTGPKSVNVTVSLEVNNEVDAQQIASTVYSAVFTTLSRTPGAAAARYS